MNDYLASLKKTLKDKTINSAQRDLIRKTIMELEAKQKPRSRSRVWSSSRGYKFLVQWTNSVLLRILVRKFTTTLPKSEYRTKTQLDDAARSIVSNIEEGYKRPTTSEYLNFLGYSQGSLEEVNGDTNKCLQDGFIKSKPKSSLKDLGIDLSKWKEYSGNSLNSSKLLYFPLEKNPKSYRTLKDIRGEYVTYEMLTELVNKTDWLIRKLVESLEKKLLEGQKGYQIDQARIKDNLRVR